MHRANSILKTKFLINILLISAFLSFYSCSKDDSSDIQSGLTIRVTSTFNNGRSLDMKSTQAEIEVTEFKMNMKEFELELDDSMENDDNESWDDDGSFDYMDEIELDGPFELDLRSGEITFINVEVPDGTYEEIEFKFHKGTDPSSEMFEKTALIRGTIDSVPFEFWYDFWDEIELDFENPQFDISIQNNSESLLIQFDLSTVLNSPIGVDLSQAQDGNNNGIIEISPDDTDGNNALAQQLRDAIKDNIDLIDD